MGAKAPYFFYFHFMEKLLVTPKNKASLTFLRKLFSKLESIHNVEVIHDEEVIDRALLAKMKRNLRTDFSTHNRVNNTLDKVFLKIK